MKNNKGVTLASIVVILIVIIIIASVGIIAGNNLFDETKTQVDDQEYTTVLNAIRGKKAEISMGGVFLPADSVYIGIENPVVGRDESGQELRAGEGWYLLEESHLKELGVDHNKDNYIVNYELEVVLVVDGNYNNENLYKEIESYNK